MRHVVHLVLQAALWSMGPLLDETGLHDSPSLIVMPISAALAVLASRDWKWALGTPAAGLGVVLVLFSIWTLTIGRASLLGAVDFALALIPFHVLGTWLLVALFWWPGRKARAYAEAA